MTHATARAFGHPESLVAQFDHWWILARPKQVTLGSLVLVARSDATAFSALPAGAFAELADATARIEAMLGAFVGFERLNYLMLMMVDPHVHFHVIPRYKGVRRWNGRVFSDSGWPGPPDLSSAIGLERSDLTALVTDLRSAAP